MELKETNRRTQILRKQPQEKEKHCEKLEYEVVTLREEYEKINKWVNAFESLERIINEKISPLIKTCIFCMASYPQCNNKNNHREVFQKETELSHSFERKSPRSKSRSVLRHKFWFHGYFFSCSSKATDCRSSTWNGSRRQDKFQHMIRNCKQIWRKKEHYLETQGRFPLLHFISLKAYF